MPIFTSRFSVARSLIGNFLSARSPGNTERTEGAAPQGRGRLSETTAEGAAGAALQSFLQRENRAAVQNATPERLDTFVNRLNSLQTAQTGQRRAIRQNQNEIRSLQAERRELQQEVQTTDQAIRQLQNRSTRLQSSARRPVNIGTSLDILAE